MADMVAAVDIADNVATPPAAVLSCRDLEVGYGSVVVARGIDITLAAGDVLAVLGPNGAGKTTLLNTIAGFLPRISGEIEVGGKPLKNGRPGFASRSGVALVPDDRALFNTLTVRENLQIAGRRASRDAVEHALEVFPALGKRIKVAAGALSGGEQQMLAVARGMVQHPKVLLIDEMSMGLAPVIVEELLPSVRAIADQSDAVVILVEQHVQLALEVADTAMVLVHGDVKLTTSAAELRLQPELLRASYLGDG